jgi:hypothetical protein
MSKVIVYKRPGNSIEVLRGTSKRLRGENEIEYLHRVANKTYPNRPFVIAEFQHGWNKKKPLDSFDSTFRTAWTLSNDGKITIDLIQAKEIWIDIIRKYRDKALRTLDIETMMALGQGDMDGVKEIEEIKQILRDVPKKVITENFQTLNELKSYWPVVLLPSPTFVLAGD